MLKLLSKARLIQLTLHWLLLEASKKFLLQTSAGVYGGRTLRRRKPYDLQVDMRN